MDEVLPPAHFDVLVKQAREEKSGRKRLMLSAKIARQIYDAERAQMELFRGAAVLAPEFKELEKERETRRYQRQEEGMKALIAEGILATGISESKAHDIEWAFTGRDLYRMLVIECGWSSDDYEYWLAQWLIKMLLDAKAH